MCRNLPRKWQYVGKLLFKLDPVLQIQEIANVVIICPFRAFYLEWYLSCQNGSGPFFQLLNYQSFFFSWFFFSFLSFFSVLFVCLFVSFFNPSTCEGVSLTSGVLVNCNTIGAVDQTLKTPKMLFSNNIQELFNIQNTHCKVRRTPDLLLLSDVLKSNSLVQNVPILCTLVTFSTQTAPFVHIWCWSQWKGQKSSKSGLQKR